MTHKDIYTKFLIEYDKQDVTSSYPSLTEYEVATILDKALLALIAQKITGNNARKVPALGDIKSVDDIRPLISTTSVYSGKESEIIQNEQIFDIPENMMYFWKGTLCIENKQGNTILPVKLVSHEIADGFKQTANNYPYVPTPVVYVEDDEIHLLYDPYKFKGNYTINELYCTFIKTPDKFCDTTNMFSTETEFELSDGMAEELINLAIIMAADTIESPRLNTKLQTISLES